MKRTTLLVFILLSITSLHSQTDLEIIKVKNDDRSVAISIVNYSETAYDIKVSMELEGMTVKEKIKTDLHISADTTIYYCTLLPTADITRYTVRFKATPIDGNVDYYAYTSPNVVLYSKNGDRKSTEARNFLKKRNIPFREYNVTYNAVTKKRYNAMLQRRGLNAGDVYLPVLIIKGEVFYNVKDVGDLLERKF